jgi:deoxyadenosine/deoxycytidine kinase
VPDAFVFLRANSGTCMARKSTRGRIEETGVDETYLRELDQRHMEFFVDDSDLHSTLPDGCEIRVLRGSAAPCVRGKLVMVVPETLDMRSVALDCFSNLESLLPKSRADVWISLEGNVAVGKTTVLENMDGKTVHRRTVRTIEEPIKEWTSGDVNLLEEFYKDPAKNAYPFQHVAFVSRMDCWIRYAKRFARETKAENIPIDPEDLLANEYREAREEEARFIQKSIRCKAPFAVAKSEKFDIDVAAIISSPNRKRVRTDG